MIEEKLDRVIELLEELVTQSQEPKKDEEEIDITGDHTSDDEPEGPSEDDAINATQAAAEKVGKEKVIAILKKYKVKQATAVKEEDRAAYIAELKKLKK